jgi:hypothetical protein
LDEVVITIRGRRHWLWRAVDHNGFCCQGSGAIRPDQVVTPPISQFGKWLLVANAEAMKAEHWT